ncbi:hypothetical protein [Streptomyces sp. TLI_171]|uniref:hypothetical protein n=1 Tax=Streptomyces sp. TLI_171 TaxID=1938859 RepID=UPI00217CE768|nr:hypothetical protein [Streptomyces sp. TLI_171]
MRRTTPTLPHPHPRRPRRRTAALLAALALTLAALFNLAGPAAAATDYTQSATQLNSSQLQISFTPTTAALYVDVHYLVNGANQQNFRMANNAGVWTQTVSSLSSGNTVEYWFTYEKSGPQYDTPHFSFTMAAPAAPSPRPPSARRAAVTPPPSR